MKLPSRSIIFEYYFRIGIKIIIRSFQVSSNSLKLLFGRLIAKAG